MRQAPSGRGRASFRRPEAMGECDRTGFWYPLSQMRRQMQWSGFGLVDTGLLVGPDQEDVPQEQYRTPILPIDPKPRINPRPSSNVTPIPQIGQPLPTSPQNFGFSSYNLGASGIPGTYPATQADAFAQILSIAGIVDPAILYFATAMPQAISTLLLPADISRTLLSLYNPTQVPVQIGLSTATAAGTITNLSLGPGQAFFWATAQGLGTTWQGAVSALSFFGANLPIWYWTNGPLFRNDGGVLAFFYLADAAGWPTAPTSLAPGAVWNNGLTIAVIPGITPSPSAAPILFGNITPQALLALGGGNLPTSAPAIGSGILWNNGGQVCVA